MPGPNATNRTENRPPAPNSPNAKTAARLAARLAAFRESSPSDVQSGLMFHRPGSQNRSK